MQNLLEIMGKWENYHQLVVRCVAFAYRVLISLMVKETIGYMKEQTTGSQPFLRAKLNLMLGLHNYFNITNFVKTNSDVKLLS